MPEIADDLTLTDGLSDVRLELDGLDKYLDSTNVDVRFRFVRRANNVTSVIATLNFPVCAENDGLQGMIARAYDELIAVLRQGLYEANNMRTVYRNSSKAQSSPQA
jgi:hypothetical protein